MLSPLYIHSLKRWHKASVGMWTWDAVDSSYFVLKAYLCGVKGDMLGSAKLSGMAGHSALYGDRFSLGTRCLPAKAEVLSPNTIQSLHLRKRT
jgi:hypothetical protein